MRSALSMAWALVAVLGGCATMSASEPKLSPEQWREVQTRELTAPRDVALRAAAGVLLDEGFLFTMSDFDAGLVAAARSPIHAHRDQAAPILSSDVQYVQLWVTQGPGRTRIRSDLRSMALRVGDSEQVTRFVAGVERRVMAAPAGGVR